MQNKRWNKTIGGKMKLLRKLRRKKINVILLFILSVVLVLQTYAWFNFYRDVEVTGLSADISAWNLQFFVGNEEIMSNEYVLEIDDFYPGMEDIDRRVDIYNIGNDNKSNIKYEVESIQMFGYEILNNDTVGEIVEKVDEEGNTYKECDLFGNSSSTLFDEESTNYPFSLRYPVPFKLTYSYNKDELGIENEEAIGWFKLHFEWKNEEDNNEEDTKLGNLAYKYYQENPEDKAAIKINLKITGTKGEKVESE